MAVKYAYRYHKVIAEADDITVHALLKQIKGRCHSPLEIDNRKGAMIHWRETDGVYHHPELPLKQADFSSYQEWVNALRETNRQILPVLCYSRQESGGAGKRYLVASSRKAYSNEQESFAGIWMPTKAYKANSMCYQANARPYTTAEKHEDLVYQVNGFLESYSDWANGENYALTVVANEKGQEEKTLIQNMFLGSGYNFCSEIARSHITLILRRMNKARQYNPDVASLEAVTMNDESMLTFFDPASAE